MSDGRIQFEYRGQMKSVGKNVSDDDAFAIVERIKREQKRVESVL